MADVVDSLAPEISEYHGVYADGVIRLSGQVDWPPGTRVVVRVAEASERGEDDTFGTVIVAGFGLAGRWIADIFDRHGIDYVIIEQNHDTVETQRKLGRTIFEGSVADEHVLREAGVAEASILALTIPDEQAVFEATRLARAINPDIYIVARTLYYSSGMRASQLGADDVVKGEQAVARTFYEMMLRKLGSPAVAVAGR